MANTSCAKVMRAGRGQQPNPRGPRPEVQPLTLSYTILADKVSLLYTVY